MLPTIDPAAGAAANVGGANQSRRSDMDKIVEAYKIAAPAKTEKQQVDNAGSEAAKTSGVQGSEAVRSKQRPTDVILRLEDQADISFQLTREEREVFLSYASGEEEPSQMTQQEQTTLQRVAERLDKLIEESDARSAKGRSRIDAAMKEWYSRLASGKQAPERLIDLIKLASQGQMDDKL